MRHRVRVASVSLAIPTSKVVFDLGPRASLPIPADFSAGGIVVRVSVAGRGLDFILDSGASESVIDAGVAQQLGLNVHDERTVSYLGAITIGYTTLDDLALGDIHAPHFAIEAIPFSRAVENKKIVGLLGGDFFASGRIAIDFSAKTVTMLAPSAPLPSEGWSKLPIDVNSFAPVTTAKFNGVKGNFVVDLGSWSTILYPHYFAKFTPDKVAVVRGPRHTGLPTKVTIFARTRSRVSISAIWRLRTSSCK